MSGNDLTLPAASESVLARLEAAVYELTGENGIIPEQLVHLTRPMPVMVIDNAGSLPGASAVPDAWRSIILTGAGPRWIDITEDEPTGVLGGDGVSNLLAVCAAAEQLALTGTVSIVTVPSILAEALRVTGQVDVFLPFGGEAATSPMSADEMFEAWSEAAGALRPREGIEPVSQGE